MYAWLGLFLGLGIVTTATPCTERVGIPISKPAVLHFPEEILDVELGNNHYPCKIKGKSLLLFAKNKNAEPTTLFVRYGEAKNSYVLEIYPDEAATLQRFFSFPDRLGQEETTADLFPPGLIQEYYDYGICKDGISVILTNVIHKDSAVYLRFFIENNTTTQLQLSSFTFEYVHVLKKFFFLEEKKTKIIKPLTGPARIDLAAQTSIYTVFSIPYYSTNGGLTIYLGEADNQGERDFQIDVPTNVLLQAKRKE
jgi:hypothetical protein